VSAIMTNSEVKAQLAEEANLDPDFAEKFLNFVIKEVIRHHEAIAAKHGSNEKTA